jgi:hypothetical protein
MTTRRDSAASSTGVDVVQEFQVVTSGGQAELGRALGGYINMVTKSGTNTVHGDLYGYFRNQRFNAANPLSKDIQAAITKLPVTQAQYGASLGGPIQRDRTFFFSNFEQRRLNQSGLARSLRRTSRPSTRAWRPWATADRRFRRASIPAGRQHQPAGQGRAPIQPEGHVQRALQPLRCRWQKLAQRGRIERAHRIVTSG